MTASICAAGPHRGGEQLFGDKCARCHGAHGEGTKDHNARMEGDLSVAKLTVLIQETMPEDNPGSLTADEAGTLAAYVHDAFYSPVAQARNRPARIELSRLTVRQYRRAIADLIASFSETTEWGAVRGLTGEYFKSRQPRDENQKAATRIDPQIDFTFGTEAPVPEITEPRTYSIRWSGSLLAPETGEYELIIRTEHAARLWINDDDVPVIDAWVKSGDETEYRVAQFLVGGRPYPVRLEFTKAKQGVDDSDKQKEKPPSMPASIALHWQRPRRVPEPIPTRYLSPEPAPATLICSTPFPPDDRSYGWERGTAISAAWDEATTTAAIEVAGYVVTRVNELADTRDNAPDRAEKLREFCTAFAERAFRNPLGEELAQTYVNRQFDDESDVDVAVRRVVLLVLKSPRFLFREIDSNSDQHNVAARLSFGLWDSIPDEKLIDAARSDKLRTEEEIRRQAERMLEDARARTKLQEFLLTWLNCHAAIDLQKDQESFPGFDAASIADLRTSLELFLDEVVWSEDSDYRQLLLCDELYLNDRLAKFYGADQKRFLDGSNFTRIRLDDGKRAGVLTHPYLLARFAHDSETSPIHRGVFLARGVLGQALRPPPDAFAPLAPDLHPGLTTRERVTLQTQPPNCMTCHAMINPLGFTLERFDAVGRYRELDRNKPVDDSATYLTGSGTAVTLRGARDLAEFLAANEECHAAFAEQMFHHLVQQPAQAYGPTILEELRQSFAEHDFNIRKLAVEIMVASACVGRETRASNLSEFVQ